MMNLINYLFKIIKSIFTLLVVYFIILAKGTENYIALTFLIYLLILLIFPYLYRFYCWYAKVRKIPLRKTIFVYISFISISTLLFIIIQWYVVDNLGARHLYRTIQEDFTQAYQTTR